MAKKPPPKPPSPPNKSKERIVPPKEKLLSREGKQLPKGDPAAGRIEAEKSVAKRQGVKPRRA